MNNLHDDVSEVIARVEEGSTMTFTNDCTSPEPSKGSNIRNPFIGYVFLGCFEKSLM